MTSTGQKSIPLKVHSGKSEKIYTSFILSILGILLLSFSDTTLFAQPAGKNIYVSTVQKYQPLLEYLNSQIPDHHFVMTDVPVSRMVAAAQQREFDFVLAAPTHFVILNVTAGATAIATRRDIVRPGVFSHFIGGVILYRSENTSIRRLEDLRNKKIAAIDPLALGGWISVGRELREVGIDPETDIRTEFQRNAESVVEALRQDRADAGVVATGTMERLLDSGKIQPGEFRILPPPEDQPEAVDFPFLRSTRLYPASAFTAMPHVPESLVRKVAIALLRLPDDSPVVRSTQTAWSLPIGYQSVHQAMQIMRVTPYQDFGKVTLRGALQQHWGKTMTVLLAIVGLLFVLLFRLAHLNRKLASSRLALQQEFEERERLITDLQKALQEVKTLSGLLPICANCKKIRDDRGYWQLVEEYIGDRTPVQFSHSICPVCMSKLYPEFFTPDENEPVMEKPV